MRWVYCSIFFLKYSIRTVQYSTLVYTRTVVHIYGTVKRLKVTMSCQTYIYSTCTVRTISTVYSTWSLPVIVFLDR